MLGRLGINVTHNCNLRCTYCYANGGDYGGNPVKMHSQEAVKRLRQVSEKHSLIRSIQFFGGEPLLNISTIEATIEEIKQLFFSGKLEIFPQINIVTNLTLLTKKVLNVLKETNAHLIISIDGPAHIHDQLRMTVKNKPTHKIILKNILTLQSSGIQFDVEATYTRIHLREKISVVDLLKYFQEFKPNRINIVNVAVPCKPDIDFSTNESWEELIHNYLEALEYVNKELRKGHFIAFGLLIDIVNALFSEGTDNFCTAGTSNITIAADGRLYACHMFTNNPYYQLKLGDDYSNLSAKIPTKKDYLECNTCWVRRWCRACIGIMEIYYPNNPIPQAMRCQLTRKSIEYVIQNLGVFSDPINTH